MTMNGDRINPAPFMLQFEMGPDPRDIRTLGAKVNGLVTEPATVALLLIMQRLDNIVRRLDDIVLAARRVDAALVAAEVESQP